MTQRTGNHGLLRVIGLVFAGLLGCILSPARAFAEAPAPAGGVLPGLYLGLPEAERTTAIEGKTFLHDQYDAAGALKGSLLLVRASHIPLSKVVAWTLSPSPLPGKSQLTMEVLQLPLWFKGQVPAGKMAWKGEIVLDDGRKVVYRWNLFCFTRSFRHLPLTFDSREQAYAFAQSLHIPKSAIREGPVPYAPLVFPSDDLLFDPAQLAQAADEGRKQFSGFDYLASVPGLKVGAMFFADDGFAPQNLRWVGAYGDILFDVIRFYHVAIALYPDDYIHYLCLGVLHYSSEQDARAALPILERAQALHGFDDERVMACRIAALYILKRDAAVSKLIAEWTQAGGLTRQGLADLYVRIPQYLVDFPGQEALARRTLLRGLEIAPEDVSHRIDGADFLCDELKDYSTARQVLEPIFNEYKDSTSDYGKRLAALHFSDIYTGLKRYDEALRWLDIWKGYTKPEERKRYAIRSLLIREKAGEALPLSEIREYVRGNTEDFEAYGLLIRTLAKEDNATEAKKTCIMLLNQYAVALEVNEAWAGLCASAGKPYLARMAYLFALFYDPEDPAVRHLYAKVGSSYPADKEKVRHELVAEAYLHDLGGYAGLRHNAGVEAGVREVLAAARRIAGRGDLKAYLALFDEESQPTAARLSKEGLAREYHDLRAQFMVLSAGDWAIAYQVPTARTRPPVLLHREKGAWKVNVKRMVAGTVFYSGGKIVWTPKRDLFFY